MCRDVQGQVLTRQGTAEDETVTPSSSAEETTELRGEYSVDMSLQAHFHSIGKVLFRRSVRLDISATLSSSTWKNVFFTMTVIVLA
jgi:hypothetical protein